MKLTTFNLFRTIAMLSCAILLAIALARAVNMGPAQVEKLAALNRAATVLALHLADMATGAGVDRMAAVLWFYLGLLVLAFSLFALAFWVRTSRQIERSTLLDAGLLIMQILIGALVESELLHLVAAELAFVFPLQHALKWLCAQMLVFVASTIPALLHADVGVPRCNVPGIVPPSALAAMSLNWIDVTGFQIFAFCVGYFACAEMVSRLTLANAHAELTAAQAQLADAIRTSEQTRIAHHLHDALGNHLTALNLQLDLAMRQVGGRAIESVRTSRELAQRLLAEVRVVVSSERTRQTINLRHALETLCAGIPSPRIVLSYDDRIDLQSPALAHAIFCIVQEAISNTVRHAGAAALHIELLAAGEGLTISIGDNGKGMHGNARAHASNGLLGIRERVEAHGGTLEIANRPEGGLGMHIWLPPSGGMQ